MRRGLSDVNEKTFDIEKFDFEGSYFRQGFSDRVRDGGDRGYGGSSQPQRRRAFDTRWLRELI